MFALNSMALCLLVVLADRTWAGPVIASDLKFLEGNDVKLLKANASDSNGSTVANPINWNQVDLSVLRSKLAKQLKPSIFGMKPVQPTEKATAIPVDVSTGASVTTPSPFSELKEADEALSPAFGTAVTRFTAGPLPGTPGTGQMASMTPQMLRLMQQQIEQRPTQFSPFAGNLGQTQLPAGPVALQTPQMPVPLQNQMPFVQSHWNFGQKQLPAPMGTDLGTPISAQMYQQLMRQQMAPIAQFHPATELKPSPVALNAASLVQQQSTRPQMQQLQLLQQQIPQQTNWMNQQSQWAALATNSAVQEPGMASGSQTLPAAGATNSFNGLPVFPNLASASSWFRRIPVLRAIKRN